MSPEYKNWSVFSKDPSDSRLPKNIVFQVKEFLGTPKNFHRLVQQGFVLHLDGESVDYIGELTEELLRFGSTYDDWHVVHGFCESLGKHFSQQTNGRGRDTEPLLHGHGGKGSRGNYRSLSRNTGMMAAWRSPRIRR